MNRYESAYRDYTQRPADGAPQRPERNGRSSAVAAASVQRPYSSHSSSSTGGDETPSVGGRLALHQAGRHQHLEGHHDVHDYDDHDDDGRLDVDGRNNGGYLTDEESYHPDQHPISSMRELSDRSGGERSNADYVVTNQIHVNDYRRWRTLF